MLQRLCAAINASWSTGILATGCTSALDAPLPARSTIRWTVKLVQTAVDLRPWQTKQLLRRDLNEMLPMIAGEHVASLD